LQPNNLAIRINKLFLINDNPYAVVICTIEGRSCHNSEKNLTQTPRKSTMFFGLSKPVDEIMDLFGEDSKKIRLILWGREEANKSEDTCVIPPHGGPTCETNITFIRELFIF
jgi:hypothetical protein